MPSADELAAGLEQPADECHVSATNGDPEASYTPSQVGRQLNKTDLRATVHETGQRVPTSGN